MTLNEFIQQIGFKQSSIERNSGYWSLNITWSTCRPNHWVISRNKLKDEDVKLDLLINSSYWVADLKQKNDLFHIQWRESGISIESQQLKFRRNNFWPDIRELIQIPELVLQLEQKLAVQFCRHLNLQGSLCTLAISESFNKAALQTWLGNSATSWGVFSD
jgi:hypothetical protein